MPCASQWMSRSLADFLVEDFDEQPADDLALGLGIGDAGQRGEVAIGGIRRG